jgi:hypothetical protein
LQNLTPTTISQHNMKKLLSILCLAIVVLTASSCQKETTVAPNNNITVFKNANSSGWTSADGGKTWSQALNVPELDDYSNHIGGVLVYLSTFSNDVYEQIPEVFNGVSYSYIHERGTLTLYAQSYDGNSITPRPAGSTVKIVLIDSN